jgi:hypothetical protein
MSNTIGLELIVEVDENQRYWVGRGFGKGGLLPTDRGCFSSTDGSLSWKSLQEAGNDLLLLGRGWSYTESDDEFLPSQDDPERCWMYSTDFRADHLLQAKPDRKLLHMVRYRRLSRTKTFHPEAFVPKEIYENCDHCDSSAMEKIATQLLETVAYCSLLHNAKELTDAIALPLKKRVVDLAMAQPTPREGDPLGSSASNQLDALRRKLEKFTEEERSQTAMGRLFSGIDFPFSKRFCRKEFVERLANMSSRAFPKIERDAIASLILRKLDIYFLLHCNVPNCANECQFARIECPNEGCSETLSRIHMDVHDAECPHKVVECRCGDSFKKKELPQHQTDGCLLREVDCPFLGIGCTKVVQARDLPQHVNDEVCSHLLLAVDMLSDYSVTTKDLASKVVQLEQENKELKQSLEAHEKELEKKISSVDDKLSKTSKALGNLETTCKKEFKNLANGK